MSANLLIPVAADHKEYETMLPNWLDTHPEGNIVLYESIKGIQPNTFDKIYLVLLEKHTRIYPVEKILASQFVAAGLANKLELVILKMPTRNQPETIAQAIKQAKISGSIWIKDPDNYFECNPEAGNFITIFPLDELERVNPRNKSYVSFDVNYYVTNIIEKKIISKYFCSGGYSFEDATLFMDFFKRHTNYDHLYMSHLVYAMLLNKIDFRPLKVKNYIDWGTRNEWNEFKSTYKTIYIPLKILFPTLYGLPGIESEIFEAVKNKINNCFYSGKIRIFIVTEKPKELIDDIHQELTNAGILFHQILSNVFSENQLFVSDLNDL